MSDADARIAQRYGLLRKQEPYGGYYERSIWILDSSAVILTKVVPWTGNLSVNEYEKMLAYIGIRENTSLK